MKHITLYFLLLLNLSSCFSQKKGVIEKIEREYFTEKITEHLTKVPLLEGYDTEQVITINKEGLYVYIKDSTIVNADMEISLYSEPNDSVNTHLIGYLKGLIKEGKREGIWTKEFKTNKQNEFVTVKRFNYSNGILDGKYQVFDINGKVLSPFLSTHFDRADKKSYYSMYKNGTGYYYDYYYNTGILKERGYYLHGKKHSVWLIYDRKGYPIKKSIYNNGVLLND
ncbi:hypothetical protein [Aquimarina aquimarini]|uniref:hypothetical protein n=1 Tax=Aquimarina aquimarini TaxID=1191734 RepID=UPI001F332F33|nr:hypothetical protein [Aquimarina aquimarini]